MADSNQEYFNSALKIVLGAGEVSWIKNYIYNKNIIKYNKNIIKIILFVKNFKILIKGFKSSKEIETKKNHQDFVTQYDKLVEKTIIDNLLKLYPNHK